MKRPFDCPTCGVTCTASEQRNGTAKLNHPLPLCGGFKPSVLMQAYVIACKPEPKYPPWDEVTQEIYRKGIE